VIRAPPPPPFPPGRSEFTLSREPPGQDKVNSLRPGEGGGGEGALPTPRPTHTALFTQQFRNQQLYEKRVKYACGIHKKVKSFNYLHSDIVFGSLPLEVAECIAWTCEPDQF
jgi:hypothetical protein